ncbi:MAG: ABC transporter substrate-binding protein [Rhodospirillales bacterium]|nr:ABC transporter substrate-binding protein [Rhodospirillales bacterium]
MTLAAWIFVPVTQAADHSPSQIVTAFHDTLLVVMKEAKALGTKGRYKKLAPRIEESFHLPLMTQVSAGSYWRKATKEQSKKLVTAFSHLSISTYASQFDGYSGQSFATRSVKPGPQNTMLVKTQILDPDSKAVDITYVTRKIKSQWRIIDVLLDNGISELAVRRSEYRRILKTGGIEGLIATLNAKADQLLVN